MLFRMKQKKFCLGNDFAVLDEQGKLAYFIDGKAFSFGEQLSFQDAARKEVAYISQKIASFTKTFTISQNKQVMAVVKKKPLTMRDKFEIDLPGSGETLQITGNFFHHEYLIHRNRDLAARVSKKLFTFTDTYGIDIPNPKDTVLLLAAAVVIDLVCHNEAK